MELEADGHASLVALETRRHADGVSVCNISENLILQRAKCVVLLNQPLQVYLTILPMMPVPTVSAMTSRIKGTCLSLTKTRSIIPTSRMSFTCDGGRGLESESIKINQIPLDFVCQARSVRVSLR